MKKYLIIIILIALTFTAMFLISCNSETTYTAEEWEELQREDEKKEEQYVQETKNIEENNEEIDDYNNRLNEYTIFVTSIYELDDKYLDEEKNLSNKFNNSNEISKAVVYAELLVELYEDWYGDISEVKVPDFMEKVYGYILEYISNRKLWNEYYSRNAENNTGDANKLLEYENEQRLSYTKMQKEYEIVMDDFNEEAESLGLPLPFTESN
jgi:hypothetical protein